MAQEVDKDVEEFLNDYVGNKYKDKSRLIVMEWIRKCNKLEKHQFRIDYAEVPYGMTQFALFEFLKKKFNYNYMRFIKSSHPTWTKIGRSGDE